MKLSMGQAAKEAKVSKTSISRAIHSGRLSAERTTSKGYLIDAAELFRVFPRNSNSDSTMVRSVTPQVTDEVTPSNSLAFMRLEMENAALKREVSFLLERVDDLRNERDDWKAQAAVVKVISDLRPRSLWSIFKRS